MGLFAFVGGIISDRLKKKLEEVEDRTLNYIEDKLEDIEINYEYDGSLEAPININVTGHMGKLQAKEGRVSDEELERIKEREGQKATADLIINQIYSHQSNNDKDDNSVSRSPDESKNDLLVAVKSILDKVTSIERKTPEPANTSSSLEPAKPAEPPAATGTPETKGTITEKSGKVENDPNLEARKYWSDRFQDVLVNGKPSKSVMETVWKQLASDSINKIFGINNHSILDSLGKGKGKKETGKAASKDTTSAPGADTQIDNFNNNAAKGSDSTTKAKGQFKEINQVLASEFQDMIVSGNSFESAMKNIWKRIASDAIKQIFHVENEANTFQALSSLGKGKKGTSTAGTCFVAGTKIKILDSEIKIEDIHIGTNVLSFIDNKIIPSVVTDVMQRISDHTYIIKAKGFTVITTEEHPFLTPYGFVKVKDLRLGDILYHDMQEVAIDEMVKIDKATVVYNITVAETHTYFANGFAVHNKANPMNAIPIKPHSGGIVGVTAIPKYFHSGGIVRSSYVPYLKNDEIPAILQTKEEVISRRDRSTNAQLMDLMGTMFQSQQQVQQQPPPVVVHISAWDTQDVYERLRKNGDALVAVLREQNALGNRF